MRNRIQFNDLIFIAFWFGYEVDNKNTIWDFTLATNKDSSIWSKLLE